MRRLIIMLLGVAFCLSILGVIYAAQQPLGNKNSSTINLYQSPTLKSTVLQKLSPTKQLVPIYYREGWIKVGDSNSGQIGWINRKQYCQAVETYYQPDIHTVFVRERNERNDEGNPVITVVAYENGKKLSDKQARQLYRDIAKQQVQASHYAQQSFWYVHHMIVEQIREMNQLMNPLNTGIFNFEPAVIQPMIILSP